LELAWGCPPFSAGALVAVSVTQRPAAAEGRSPARPELATVPGAVLTRPNGCHITATVRLLLAGGRHGISWSHRGNCGGRSLVGQGVGGAHHGRGPGAWPGNEATIGLRPDTYVL